VGDGGEGVLGKIRAAIVAGVDWVQIREKDYPGGSCWCSREELSLGAASRE